MRELENTEKWFYDLTYIVHDAIIPLNDEENLILWNETVESRSITVKTNLSVISLPELLRNDTEHLSTKTGFIVSWKPRQKRSGDLFKMEMTKKNTVFFYNIDTLY